MKSLAPFPLAWLAAGSLAQAAPPELAEALLLRYNAPVGNEFAPGFVAAGITAGVLSPGTSTANLEAGAALPGTVFLNPTLASPDVGSARANDQFFEFSLAGDSSREVILQSLSFEATRGGASGPRGWALFSSLDGFTAPLASADVDALQPDRGGYSVPLADLPLSTDELVFRLYAYSPDEGQGLFFAEITLDGLLEVLRNTAFRPELLLSAASSTLHGGRQFHRALEQETLGRAIPAGEKFHAWGGTGTDWFGGGSGETTLAQGGFSFQMAGGVTGQVAGSLEFIRGAPVDANTLRLGFAVDRGGALGLHWMGYLGAFAAEYDSSQSGSILLASAPASLETSGLGLQAAAAAAWWFKQGPVRWAPFAGVEYLRLAVDDATFDGAPTPAIVSLDDLDSLRSHLGVRGVAELPGSPVRPFGSLALATEWSGSDRGTLTTPTGVLPVNDPNGRGTSLVIAAGLGFPLAGPVHASVSYTGELPLSGNGQESHGIRFGIHAVF
jgi:hypothetical protein